MEYFKCECETAFAQIFILIILRRKNAMYDVKSKKAEEFIDDLEIKKTIEFAEKNKKNKDLINEMIEKEKK